MSDVDELVTHADALDEQIALDEYEQADLANPELVDLVIRHGLHSGVLDFDDLRAASLVSPVWNSILTGEVTADQAYLEAFKERFPSGNAIVRFYKFRAEVEKKAIEQSLLLLFEGQMLLRELAEYKNPPAPRIYQDIRNLLAKLSFDDEDMDDLLAKIRALRNELVKRFMRNATLEKQLTALEHTIGLLIQHRASIHELDRKKKKKKKGAVTTDSRPTFYKDSKKMAHYSNLFYLIRTEPKYLARLAYLIPPNQKQKTEYANTVILTLYANAFSPLEEFLILELLQNALKQEIDAVATVDEFVSSDSATPMMIISYNKRKQGKNYVKSIFKSLLNDLIEDNTEFSASPTGGAPKLDLLTAQCDKFLERILETIDALPYGFRLICKHIYDYVSVHFENDKKQRDNIWRAVGYYVYYRFVGLGIVRPDDFGVVDKDDINDILAMNLIGISKVLKALFMITVEQSGPYTGMNDWIISKHDIVSQYLKNVIDVPPAEEYLKVNKYGQLARKEKATIVILLRQICQLHALLADNVNEITDGEEDPLALILNDLGTVPTCDPEDETELNLDLTNRFPPQLSKIDLKKNLLTTTIDDAIGVLKAIPGFSGNTFLEIFVRMKLHAKKIGDDLLAGKVNQVIANLQNLAKHGLVSPKDGFNSFLTDIHNELVSRETRYAEQLKEVERLNQAISELDVQKDFMSTKSGELNVYLNSVRENAASSFKQQTKKFKYKDLSKSKVIADSEIPHGQQGKVVFEIKHEAAETFHIKGKIKNLPGFSRNFDIELGTLLEAREDGLEVFDTEKGLELNVQSTLIFLNKNFYHVKK
eukprot:TRINITY_DN1009_c0_g1_i1.p1 TRINITY_DN1009_c0_g1~~TRINITY_DN1009_c0_g1_i1.p1  ORF type:complete len:826 (+),score=273.65 TRINITY_DN1009_c0_g1_i1:23-2479(+)